MLIVGCSDKPREMYVKKFHAGDVVAMKIDGRKGMVLSVTGCLINERDTHHSCDYRVRFSTGSVRTDTHVLDEDGPLRATPYETLLVYDYELALAESVKK
ncbi:MAG: hypothetical protein WA058_00630 [Minisyncoccia bacterium]